jgi:predicted XRE-type DNA-binding protein
MENKDKQLLTEEIKQDDLISMTKQELEELKQSVIQETISQVEQKQLVQNEINQAPEINRPIINDLLSTGKDLNEIKTNYAHLFKQPEININLDKFVNGEKEKYIPNIKVDDDALFLDRANKGELTPKELTNEKIIERYARLRK